MGFFLIKLMDHFLIGPQLKNNIIAQRVPCDSI